MHGIAGFLMLWSRIRAERCANCPIFCRMVVSRGTLYCPSAMPSKPVTEISCGTQPVIPQRTNCAERHQVGHGKHCRNVGAVL